MARATAVGSVPVIQPPPSTTSASAPRPVVMTGRPRAKASAATRPNGSSQTDGTRTARAAAISRSTSPAPGAARSRGAGIARGGSDRVRQRPVADESQPRPRSLDPAPGVEQQVDALVSGELPDEDEGVVGARRRDGDVWSWRRTTSVLHVDTLRVEPGGVHEPASERLADGDRGGAGAGEPAEDRRRPGHEQAAARASRGSSGAGPRGPASPVAQRAVRPRPELGALDARDPQVAGGPHHREPPRQGGGTAARGQEREQVVDVDEIGPHPGDVGLESSGRGGRPRGRRRRPQLVHHATRQDVVVGDLMPVHVDARGTKPASTSRSTDTFSPDGVAAE